MIATQPCGAHLVGSVPLAGTRAVFSAVNASLARYLRRLPDGETGARTNWIAWQNAVFQSMPELAGEIVETGYIKRPKYRPRAGVDASNIRFPALGYAHAAIESYALFREMRASGGIASHLRFQVCLPTPLAPLHSYVFADSLAALEAPYEARLLDELDEIVAAIPAADLAIQWDTAIEFAILEGVMPTHFADPWQDILDRLVRWGDRVPAAVELGYHLCYGDAGHKHFKEPQDAAKLVRVANHLARHLRRPLHWLHLPVPRNRSDEAYFAPLAQLALAHDTELYLGLVHATDGIDGTRRRIEAARRFVPRFGVGTECGFGRRSADSIPALLAIHSAVAAPLPER